MSFSHAIFHDGIGVKNVLNAFWSLGSFKCVVTRIGTIQSVLTVVSFVTMRQTAGLMMMKRDCLRLFFRRKIALDLCKANDSDDD
jgi:hypothetical protein